MQKKIAGWGKAVPQQAESVDIDDNVVIIPQKRGLRQ